MMKYLAIISSFLLLVSCADDARTADPQGGTAMAGSPPAAHTTSSAGTAADAAGTTSSAGTAAETAGTTSSAGTAAETAGTTSSAGTAAETAGTTSSAGTSVPSAGTQVAAGVPSEAAGQAALGGTLMVFAGQPSNGGTAGTADSAAGQSTAGHASGGTEAVGGDISTGDRGPAGGLMNQGGFFVVNGGATTGGGEPPSGQLGGISASGGEPVLPMGGISASGGEPVLPMGGGEGPIDTCPDEAFLSVAQFQGPGDAYPAPALDVACGANTMTVRSNGIPHYEYVARTPNGLSAQNYSWTIPLNPTYVQQTTRIPCLGTVGFAINGVPIFGPNEAQMPDPYGDPVANGVMDEAEGHSGANGMYHYHAFVESAFFDADGDRVPDLLDDEPLQVDEGPSPILGFALDGFPIYGPRGCVDAECQRVVTFKSSYEHTNFEANTEGCVGNQDCTDANAYVCAPTILNGQPTTACVYKDYAWDYHEYRVQAGEGWLDECNGRIGPDGTYRYHATNTFPYLIGCYHGEIQANNAACPSEGGVDNGGGNNNGGGMAPPQAAQDACAGLADGDQCRFEGRNGMQVNGTCAIRGGVLACGP